MAGDARMMSCQDRQTSGGMSRSVRISRFNRIISSSSGTKNSCDDCRWLSIVGGDREFIVSVSTGSAMGGFSSKALALEASVSPSKAYINGSHA